MDGSFIYIYDAWNRLVAVKSQQDTDITIQTAEFDATGRRIRANVTNSGDLDAETRYYYDGWKIAETRVGASPTTYHQQFFHGTQPIHELVMVRAIDKGDLYIHQDANWNVIGTTDLAASIVERNVYTPYGQLTVNQETSFGDRDGDGDVDATDKGTPGTTCTGTVTGACRILDLDFDGDYDSTDATKFDALTQGIARHQGRTATATNQPFAHQGLLFEPELASYQNRTRQYVPNNRRFAQRDPLGLMASAAGGYQDGLNLYAYAGLNPLAYSDPLGACICLFKGNVGKLTIDPSCKGKCAIWVIPENANNPAYTPAVSGKSVWADGFKSNGQIYKIDGSTCVTISDGGNGSLQLDTCVNFCAQVFGSGAPSPVPPGTFANEPPSGPAQVAS